MHVGSSGPPSRRWRRRLRALAVRGRMSTVAVRTSHVLVVLVVVQRLPCVRRVGRRMRVGLLGMGRMGMGRMRVGLLAMGRIRSGDMNRIRSGRRLVMWLSPRLHCRRSVPARLRMPGGIRCRGREMLMAIHDS